MHDRGMTLALKGSVLIQFAADQKAVSDVTFGRFVGQSVIDEDAKFSDPPS